MSDNETPKPRKSRRPSVYRIASERAPGVFDLHGTRYDRVEAARDDAKELAERNEDAATVVVLRLDRAYKRQTIVAAQEVEA